MEICEYCDEWGNVCYPDEFENLLDGKTIEEQKAYFRVGNELYLKKPFLERRKNRYDASYKLDETPKIEALVVKNNKIAGIKVWDEQKYCSVICKPESGYCSYYEEELDGSGYKTCSFYRYLICVSSDFE